LKLPRLFIPHTLSGTMPLSILCAIFSDSSFFKPAKVSGRTPEKELKLASSTVTSLNDPISAGRDPIKPLLDRMISFKVDFIFPMVFGMKPSNLLLAKTKMETVELPKFSGMLASNRLLFKNKASRSLSKSLGGSDPSKLLNRRSRYLRAGKSRTTKGNWPTSQLLLTSSSWRRVRLERLEGRTPQNRLELMWRMAVSLRRPISIGIYPARSAPLKSTLATTRTEGSSREGAQTMPL